MPLGHNEGMGTKVAVVAGIRQLPLIRAAAERAGIEIVAAGTPGEPPSTGVLVDAARNAGAAGILPASGAGALAVADACARLGLPGHAPEVVRRCLDKDILRRSLAVQRIPQPQFRLVESAEDAEEAARELGTPVVVRPARKHGARRFDYAEDAALGFLKARKAVAEGPVLVEQYVDGPRFVLDGIVRDGMFLLHGTIEKVAAAAWCHSCAAAVPARWYARSTPPLELATAALHAMGLKSGCAHVEVAWNGKGFVLLRLACYPAFLRLPVDLIALGGGPDTVVASLAASVGGGGTEAPPGESGAAVVWLQCGSGIVSGISGLERAMALPGVIEVAVEVQPGEVVGHLSNRRMRDRVGHVIATGTTADEALAHALRAAACCEVTTSQAL